MIFRYLLFILILFILIVACEDEYYGPTDNNGNGSSADFIETNISLSPDREYIYFSVRDTIYNYYSGINRARVSQPVRERIYAGNNYYSPTINFDNNVLAYLYDSLIHYYYIAEDSMINSGIVSQFESILYINLNVLLAEHDGGIFLINEEDSSYQYLCNGWNPTLVSADTFLFFATLDNYTFHIIKDNVDEPNPETLYTIRAINFPHWPTLDPKSGHLAYSIKSNDQYLIYSGVIGESPELGETSTFIDSSDYSKPYILNNNQIIFSGPNGSLYQSDFEGTKSVPFIHIEN